VPGILLGVTALMHMSEMHMPAICIACGIEHFVELAKIRLFRDF
jgi:hypothetical protein